MNVMTSGELALRALELTLELEESGCTCRCMPVDATGHRYQVLAIDPSGTFGEVELRQDGSVLTKGSSFVREVARA